MDAAGLLAVLELEREPLVVGDLPGLLVVWAREAGGFAAIAWLVGGLVFLVNRTANQKLGVVGWLTAAVGSLGILLFAAALFLQVFYPPAPEYERNPDQPELVKKLDVKKTDTDVLRENLAAAGGALALAAILIPFLADAVKLRPRRIYALAKLAFKEAIRRRILWVLLAFLLVFLFPPKWFRQIKLEDEVRVYTSVVDLGQTLLMLLAFGLLAAFSLPTDLRNQTIHTIVTKPVERFEIVLGRILGFTALATLALVVFTGFSLLMLFASGVSLEAAEESYKARVPVYGELSFRGREQNFKGESVGYEREYRKYIAGGARTSQRAQYAFLDGKLPTGLASRADIPVEFAFDIFRTTKGEENKGVFATLTFLTPKWIGDPAQVQKYQDATRGLNLSAQPPAPGQPADPDWQKLDKLAEEYGFYEYRSKEIFDFHTLGIVAPGGILRAALAGPPPTYPSGQIQPRLLIEVKCESRTQFLGMAKRDLYLLAGNNSFAWNYFKGAVGLWLRIVLVIGVAVVLSTYLSGVVSWLLTMSLLVAGYFRDFIGELANGMNVGGGPTESMIRLVGNKNITSPLEKTAFVNSAQRLDDLFGWAFGKLLAIIPDVDRYDWSNHIAEGFNIGGDELALTVLFLVGYLLPWAVLGYYVMKTREVAA